MEGGPSLPSWHLRQEPCPPDPPQGEPGGGQRSSPRRLHSSSTVPLCLSLQVAPADPRPGTGSLGWGTRVVCCDVSALSVTRRSVLTPHPWHPPCSWGCLLPSSQHQGRGCASPTRDPAPAAGLAALVAEHPSAPRPGSPLVQLRCCPSSPVLASYLLRRDRHSQGAVRPAARASTPGTGGDWRGLEGQRPAPPRAPAAGPSLRTLQSAGPLSGMSALALAGQGTLPPLRGCRRALPGRRSAITAGSGSGSARSRRVGGFAQRRWQPRNVTASPVPRQLKGSAAPRSCWWRAERLRRPKRRTLGRAPLAPPRRPRERCPGSGVGSGEPRAVAAGAEAGRGAPALAGEEPHGRDWRA